MCGIAGYIDFNSGSNDQILHKMLDTLMHRGPDDAGTAVWQTPFGSIGIGQRRLSIIDLSQGGHQPMHFGELSIVFNGEIYNYKEIKSDLEKKGHQFVSNSDTEVILHAYSEWGKQMTQRLIGMFAIVLYDHKRQEILFIRDRAGIKPLYVYSHNGLVLFASELKAFHQHPDFHKEIDLKALESFMHLGYIPTPSCIFQHCSKLLAGHIQYLQLEDRQFKFQQFWNIFSFYHAPKTKLNYQEAKEELHTLLKSACEYRMISDVPVGVFLSGGYDSTAITALLQAQRNTRLKTFTIGFEEGNNEAPFASQTAKYLGTDHTEYICRTKEAQEIIPLLPHHYDEPFGDSSAIPTMLVSKVARQQVTVALSADAGDELFAGYSSYQKLTQFQNRLNGVPANLKQPLSWLLQLAYQVTPVKYSSMKHKLFGVGQSLNKDPFLQAYLLHHFSGQTPQHIIKRCLKQNALFENKEKLGIMDLVSFKEEIDPVLATDYSKYLMDDILTKVDRATMSVSLEGREPLVDHRLAEFAASLPLEFKTFENRPKSILKDIVHEYIPQSMMDRPKTGFSLPINNWLRTELSFLLDDYLNKSALSKPGCWNVQYCSKLVQQFKASQLHFTPVIWYLLMFQMWYFTWMENQKEPFSSFNKMNQS
ncbi:MAG: asparagine synthase (glutamine-hydrolyzing) [Saprospiraceae bacterium]|nr:asparagine synthase (glutamine-hydrolyzing) [Saprospiraceae bacterium]